MRLQKSDVQFRDMLDYNVRSKKENLPPLEITDDEKKELVLVLKGDYSIRNSVRQIEVYFKKSYKEVTKVMPDTYEILTYKISNRLDTSKPIEAATYIARA